MDPLPQVTCLNSIVTLHSPMLMVTFPLCCIESCCEDNMDSGTCSQLSHVTLLSLRAHHTSDPSLSPSLFSLWRHLSVALPTSIYSLSSLAVVISALVLSLASPPATAAASRASCHSSEGQWSGQLSPGTHHLHTVPSQPPPSHIIQPCYPAMLLIIFKPSHSPLIQPLPHYLAQLVIITLSVLQPATQPEASSLT